MKRTAVFLALAFAFATTVRADSPNLFPNGDLSDKKNPMLGIRTDFSYEPWYGKNASYIKLATDQKSKSGGNCILMDVPTTVGIQGAKIETEPVKCEPGATYKMEVDMLGGSGRLFAEIWVRDPLPKQKRDKFRTPEVNGIPPLLMVHRWDFKGKGGKKQGGGWNTITSPLIEVPKSQKVNTEGTQGAPSDWAEVPPEYITLKVFIEKPGKYYLSNFRLYKVK